MCGHRAAPTEPAERLPFAVREGRIEDAPLIMDAWLLCERDARGHESGAFFMAWQKADQRAILGRRSTRVRIATPDDDPGTILGFLVWSDTRPACVYYLYTKHAVRRLGIAKMLLGDLALRTDVFYCARPARTWNDGAHRWEPSPVTSRIPRTWRFVPDVKHHEVT